jgi:hypothetical protein
VAVYGQQPFFVVEALSAYVPPHPGPKQTGRVCTSLWQLQTLVLVMKPGWRQCTGWRRQILDPTEGCGAGSGRSRQLRRSGWRPVGGGGGR